MIIPDGVCYQAKDDGSIVRAEDAAGVPFAGFSTDPKIECFCRENGGLFFTDIL